MRGEWDILIINDDKFEEPYGTLSVTQNNIDLIMPCRPNIYGGYNVVEGKLVSNYGERYIEDQLNAYGKSCLNTPGHSLAKSLLSGRFYGDRKTIWFDGPYISFIAKRANRTSSKYGGSKYLAVEACLLDHSNIGADKYAGFGWFNRVPNHRMQFSLTEDGEDYWDDCRPDWPVEVATVKYSLAFLEAKLQTVKTDIKPYESRFITGGWVQQQLNAIVVRIDPDWAKDNQAVMKRLEEQHPYIELREDLPFDEIIVTAH